jgi:ketosteroid isomerase-like protein
MVEQVIKTVRVLAISLFVSALLTGCWKEPSRYKWSNAAGTEQHERLMWQAIRDKNWTEVENHLAPVFVGTDTSGRNYDHAAWIDYWKAAQVRDFSLGEVTVQPGGADMVVTYELHLSGERAGQPIPSSPVRVVSVWQHLKKGWVLIAQSSTPIKTSS